MGDGLHVLARPAAPQFLVWRDRAAAFASTAAFDACIVAGASTVALVLGVLNAAAPSFWHDELVHVYVARNLAETGVAALPSGMPYYNGTALHIVLAAVYAIWGDSEIAMRAPAAVCAALNVVLVFIALRPLVGRHAALVAAVGLALSPWAVAWARQARFYSLHQGLYIAFVAASWRMISASSPRHAVLPAIATVLAFVVGILTSFHALLYLAGPGIYAAILAIRARRWRSRWSGATIGLAALGLVGIVIVRLLMNPVDRAAIVENGGLGGSLVFPEQAHRFYYLLWLKLNLSTGFLLLAFVGTVWMLARERSRGLYAALAFWAPCAVLTFLVGYRWPKFLFFAYPFFIAAWAYALSQLIVWMRRPKPDWTRRLAAAAVALFLLRLGVSAFRLTADSVEAASGANITLATRHPQWREPCRWVRQHGGDAAILTTSYLPVHYYVGRVDEWYPSRALPWEAAESGLPGLASLDDLKAFVRDHPTGFFIAEWWRFERNYKGAPWADFSEDIAWVQANMRRIDEAGSGDVTVYAWGGKAGSL